MEEVIIAFIFSLQGLFAFTCLILLIVFINRRLKAKKEEDFEDRDN